MKVWIVDDEEEWRKDIGQELINNFGNAHDIRKIDDGKKACRIVEEEKDTPDIIILDYFMPDMNGIETLEHLRAKGVDAPTIMLSGYREFDADVAMQALDSGVFTCMWKPFKPEELVFNIHVAERIASLKKENRNLRYQSEFEKAGGIIGKSQSFKQAIEIAARVAQSDASVLILGENGTGKELIAKAIHKCSPRQDNNFMTFNVSSEFSAGDPLIRQGKFFGYGRGHGIPGIPQNGQKGVLEECDGGTIFLDEIGSIPEDVQVALLRVLEGYSFYPAAGERREIKVDVRFLFATNADMEQLKSQGKIREDFYYRIKRVVKLPPLRERKEDIPLLAVHFLKKHSKSIEGFTEDALEKLMNYPWPGNVRELENVIENTADLFDGKTPGLVTLDSLQLDSKHTSEVQKISDSELRDMKEQLMKIQEQAKSLEITMIEKALEASKKGEKYNVSRAAAMLDEKRQTLRKKMNRYGIQLKKQ